MRKTAILFAVVLAMLARPLQLPAASCVLSNAPSHKACKMDCCGNKTCCAVPKKNPAPNSQPLYQAGAAKQQDIAFVAVPVSGSIAENAFAQPPCATIPVRAHSPPPLAATCIRLI